MSKIILMGEDNEIKSEILRLVQSDYNFAKNLLDALNVAMSNQIQSPFLQTNNIITENILVKNNLSIDRDFAVNIEGYKPSGFPIRVNGGYIKMFAHDMNIENLYVKGRKINVLEEQKIHLVQDSYASWS